MVLPISHKNYGCTYILWGFIVPVLYSTARLLDKNSFALIKHV